MSNKVFKMHSRSTVSQTPTMTCKTGKSQKMKEKKLVKQKEVSEYSDNDRGGGNVY